ncbi:MAG: tetratricopeptide repeat protein [Balneolales bacterium]
MIKVLIASLTSIFVITACSASAGVNQSNIDTITEARSEASADGQQDVAFEDIIEARSLYIKGITHFELGDFDRAVEYLISAQSLHPGNSGINYALMDAYLKLEDLSNASYYGQQAVELEPLNKWYRLKLSETFRQLGQIDDAFDQLNAILEENPNDVDILFLIASVQSNQGRYRQSNKTYERILNLTGSDRSVHYQRFQNFTNLGEHESAIMELEEIRKLAPGNLNTLHTLSQFYLENKQIEEAKDVLEDALKRNPRDPETLVSLSDIYINEGNWQAGGEILNSIISDSLINTSSKVELVQYMLSRFPYEQENEDFFGTIQDMVETLVAQDDDSGMSHALAAEYYHMIEDYSQALKHLEQTNRLMPDNEAAWRQRLQLLQMQNRHDETIEVGQEANERVPDDASIQFFIGGAYFLTENYENAVNWLEKASGMPSRANFKSVIYGTLGDAYASQDEWDAADEAYKNALRYDSENDVTLNNYAYYLVERDKKIDEAKEMVSKALSLKPENASYLDTMGWIYYKLGEYEKAREYIEAALEASTSAEVMEHMGDVFEKLGDLDKAMYWWQKALEKDETRSYLEEKLTGF